MTPDYQRIWQASEVAAQSSPRQPYLTPATLELVRLRKAYRQYLAAEHLEDRRRRLLLGFAAFVHLRCGTGFSSRHRAVLEGWFRAIDCSVATATRNLRRTGRDIRLAVKRDRLSYLADLQRRVAQQDLRNPKELYRALRSAFPQARSARRSGFRPLPQLQLADGTFAVTQEERMQRWGQHFAEQESGFALSEHDYVRALRSQKQLTLQARQGSCAFAWEALVSLPKAELLVLSQRTGKATGYDGVSAELMRVHAPSAARRLLPIFTKAALALSEPVAYRGGCLLVLAKRAGAACSCADFRSILVETAPAKLYHRHLRSLLVPHLRAVSDELQAGAVPGTGIEALSLVARSFQALSASQHRPWAILLYDIKAAFLQGDTTVASVCS